MHTIFRVVLLIQAVWAVEVDFKNYDVETTELNLSRQSITRIKNLDALPNLKYLNLSGNKLIELPPEIGELQSLKELRLSGNDLKKLPIEIGYLDKLETIGLEGNDLGMLGDGVRTIGRVELVIAFENIDGLDRDVIEFKRERISKDNLYKKLKSKSISWNFDVLPELKPSCVPQSDHTEESAKDVWNQIYMKWKEPKPEKIEKIIYKNERILIAMYGSTVEELMDARRGTLSKIFSRNRNKSKRAKSIAKILALLVENVDENTMKCNVSKLKEKDKEQFIRLWNEHKEEFIVNNNKWMMENFIHHIYNPTEEYSGQPIPEDYVDLIKNLIGAYLISYRKKKIRKLLFRASIGYVVD